MKTSPNLLRLIDALRPEDYRCLVIDPRGETTHEAQFATKAEADADAWCRANRDERDVAFVHYINTAERN